MRIRPYLRCAGRLGLLPLICLSLRAAHAGSATWNLNPISSDWNTAANWTPATVPNSTIDIATFGASNTTSILTSANVDLASLVFTQSAPSYTIATDRTVALTFWDEGIRNDSGVQHTFTGGFSFNESSSAGDNVSYGLGSLSFNDNSTAGSASFRNTQIDFFDNASADQGVFTNASILFHNNSTAGNGIFTLGDGDGGVTFYDTASAGNADFTLTGMSGGRLCVRVER